jgi:hypothetical protein
MFLTRLLLFAALFAGAAAPAFAQADDAFRFVFVGQRDYTTVGHGDHSFTAGSVHGVLTVPSAGPESPFTEETRLHGTCATAIKTEGSSLEIDSHCTFQDLDEDEVYLEAHRDSGDAEVGGGGLGSFVFTGGTGKFAGITGIECPYEVHYMDDDDTVVTGRCRP